jgi:hypothetical protein
VNAGNVTSSSGRWTLGVITVALAVLAGCANSPAGQPHTKGTAVAAPTLASRFTTLEVRRAGGIAGTNDKVAVTPDGSWTTTAKNGATKTGKLSEAQLDQLVALASDPRLGQEALRTQAPTQCRDAFSYVVTVDAVGVAYVDCSVDGGLPEIARQVVGVIQQAGAL